MSRPRIDLAALGTTLRDLRTQAGLTQERLSFKSGLTTALISDTENGKRNLSFRSVESWLAAVGVGWDEFGAALTRAARRKRV